VEIDDSRHHICPVCGFTGLEEYPRSADGGASYEICPSCGFQFGVDDDDRGFSYSVWRRSWVERGMPWTSAGTPAPDDWNPQAQLMNIDESW
jgi:hypothetical protein